MMALGRILVRKDACGLYLPLAHLKPGIYELRDCLGILLASEIGSPEMQLEEYNSLLIQDLFARRWEAALTHKEYMKQLAREMRHEIENLKK